jgi:hypothetical protein
VDGAGESLKHEGTKEMERFVLQSAHPLGTNDRPDKCPEGVGIGPLQRNPTRTLLIEEILFNPMTAGANGGQEAMPREIK